MQSKIRSIVDFFLSFFFWGGGEGGGVGEV